MTTTPTWNFNSCIDLIEGPKPLSDYHLSHFLISSGDEVPFNGQLVYIMLRGKLHMILFKSFQFGRPHNIHSVEPRFHQITSSGKVFQCIYLHVFLLFLQRLAWIILFLYAKCFGLNISANNRAGATTNGCNIRIFSSLDWFCTCKSV